MTIHIKKDGWEITGDTFQELKQGIRAVQEALLQVTTTPKRVGRPPKEATGTSAPATVEREKTALDFLRAINGRSDGIPASELCTALGLKTKRGIGTPAGVANRVLNELGFQKDSVYMRTKKVNQEKKWYPKSKMADAIAAIEQTKGKT